MTLVWSEDSYDDRIAIFDFIAADSTDAAMRVEAKIQEQAERLRSFPEIGRAGRVEGTRELPVKGLPYVIVYTVQPQRVWVHRVLHGAQRWPTD